MNLLTSFLNICRSVPPNTSHLLLHKKLRNPSSLTFACPVLITVFLPSLECAAGLRADAGLRIGKDEAYDEDEKFGFGLVELWDPEGGGPPERDPPPGTGGAGREGVRDEMLYDIALLG